MYKTQDKQGFSVFDLTPVFILVVNQQIQLICSNLSNLKLNVAAPRHYTRLQDRFSLQWKPHNYSCCLL